MAEVLFHPDGITNRVKIIAGEVALDGTNPTSISYAGKISTVIAVQVVLKLQASPGVLASVFTYGVDTTNKEVDIYSWKVTNSTTTTLVADTGVLTVSYFIIGY